MKRFLLCGIVLFSTALPALAEQVIGIEVPSKAKPFVASQKDRSKLFFPVPNSTIGLLASSDDGGRCRLTLLERTDDGDYVLRCQTTVDANWTSAYSVEMLPLESTPDDGLAVAFGGSTINILIFEEGLSTEPKVFSFFAGSGASPWSVPGYAMRSLDGKIVIVDEWESMGEERPDGSHESESTEGPAVMYWDGQGFAPMTGDSEPSD